MALDLDALEADAVHAQRNNWLRVASPDETLALVRIARAAVAWRDCGYAIENPDPVVVALGQALLDAGL